MAEENIDTINAGYWIRIGLYLAAGFFVFNLVLGLILLGILYSLGMELTPVLFVNIMF